jgi:ABC-type xylose transport system permease subunit
VFAGLAIAFVCVWAIEFVVHRLYPPPPGYNMQDMTQMKAFVSKLPLAAFVLVLAGWAVGTFLGTFTAARIARNRIPAYVVGALLLAAGIMNARVIPQPLWFDVASFAVYIGGTLAGARAGAG